MTKIYELTETTGLTNDDVLIVSDGTLSKKIKVKNFKTALLNKASKTEAGVVRVGSGLEVSDAGVISVRNYSAYVLPAATENVLGGIRIGAGLSIDAAGVVRTTYSLPPASRTSLGGVIAGAGLNVDSFGTISVDSSTRNIFEEGILVGNSNLSISSSTGISSIIELTKGELRIGVEDNAAQLGSALLSILSTSKVADTGCYPMAAVVSIEPMTVGTEVSPFASMYATNFVGNVTGNVAGNVTGNVTGNLYASDSSIAYDASTKEFTGVFKGIVTGIASSAEKLATPKRINGTYFDGSGDITIVDATRIAKSGDRMSGFLELHADPVLNDHAANKKYVDTVSNLRISKTGGTMTGHLGLVDAPALPIHAANKQYVDDIVNKKLSLSGGTLSGPVYSQVVPTTNTHIVNKEYVDETISSEITTAVIQLRQYVDTQDSKKLNLAGGTMSGAIVLPSMPASNLEATNKRYVDQQDESILNSANGYTNSVAVTKLDLAGGIMTGFINLHADPSSSLHPSTKRYTDAGLTRVSSEQSLYTDRSVAPKVNRSGDAFTGYVSLHADPTTRMHAATKQYVDMQDEAASSSLREYVDSMDQLKVNVAGSTMSGFLTLNADPVKELHAATKQYVDAAAGSLNVNVRAYIDARDNTRLPISGGTMTGMLTLNSNPLLPLHAATKQYVDSTRPAELTVTYGTNLSVHYGSTYIDVFPPSGYSMGNFVAFMPALASNTNNAYWYWWNDYYYNYYNNNDITWTKLADRVRITLNNNYYYYYGYGNQRINWVAFWR